MADQRTETSVVEVDPEKKPRVVRMKGDFGWKLVSAQEDAKLVAGRAERKVKLLFTRTGPAAWIDEMKAFEEELQKLDTSVKIGSDGLVMAGEKPITTPPIPILIVIAFAGYLIGWLLLDVMGGILSGFLFVAGSAILFMLRAKKKAAQYRKACERATEAFKKKRVDLLNSVRALNATNTPTTPA